MISALLNSFVDFPILQQGYYIDLNWLGQLVRIIIEGIGIVGVGVIVFALILKAITTPFDIYQRVSMRKQNLIMKEMQPELEKLQKQYANDKQTYSMKMMELQKKNGYSMFGACLPMIISLAILIIAIGAFQSYAQYANLSMYEKMSGAYNEAVLAYAVNGKDYHLAREGEDDGLTVVPDTFGEDNGAGERSLTEDGIVYTLRNSNGTYYMYVESTSPDVFLRYSYELGSKNTARAYSIDADKLYAAKGQELASYAAEGASLEDEETRMNACYEYMKHVGAQAAAENFRSQSSPRFLWVANVWYPDVSYNHPVQDYKAFTSTFNGNIRSSEWEGEKRISEIVTGPQYENLTSELSAEKEQPNGYFGLIIISIGLMLLSQFITMRSQKEANQYQTVDGQGNTTQKTMLVVMPIMFAIFGFLWSAAFTIYNIISSVLSIAMTLVANLIIDRIFNKKEEEKLKSRYTRSAPWKQDEKKRK